MTIDEVSDYSSLFLSIFSYFPQKLVNRLMKECGGEGGGNKLFDEQVHIFFYNTEN